MRRTSNDGLHWKVVREISVISVTYGTAARIAIESGAAERQCLVKGKDKGHAKGLHRAS
jgi:hypothetical protein